MENLKHTPGPWTIMKNFIKAFAITLTLIVIVTAGLMWLGGAI